MTKLNTILGIVMSPVVMWALWIAVSEPMVGRSPYGSGFRPSDRAAYGVSPVPASIPSAEQR
jgi:hypothetical protein